MARMKMWRRRRTGYCGRHNWENEFTQDQDNQRIRPLIRTSWASFFVRFNSAFHDKQWHVRFVSALFVFQEIFIEVVFSEIKIPDERWNFVISKILFSLPSWELHDLTSVPTPDILFSDDSCQGFKFKVFFFFLRWRFVTLNCWFASHLPARALKILVRWWKNLFLSIVRQKPDDCLLPS